MKRYITLSAILVLASVLMAPKMPHRSETNKSEREVCRPSRPLPSGAVVADDDWFSSINSLVFRDGVGKRGAFGEKGRRDA